MESNCPDETFHMRGMTLNLCTLRMFDNTFSLDVAIILGELIRNVFGRSLRKHAYSNIFKISPPKTERVKIKILIFFLISAQNIDYGCS